MSFSCYHCNSTFLKKYNLKRHIAKHSNEKENVKKNRIVCCICFLKFENFSKYHEHLETLHGLPININISQFANFQEFQNWKIDFEKKTSSNFVQNCSAKKLKNQGTTYYFYCHRSFLGKTHPRKTTTKEKNAGSNKSNASCPAMMKAIVTNEAVQVEFCPTHLGHKCDIGRLRLTIEERNLLAEKLSAGIPPTRILADIRQEAPAKLDRIHHVKLSDLYNIKRAYSITCPLQYDNEDHISVDSWIYEEISQEADSPVLFYKNQDSDHENFEKSDFILIIMTKFQKEMLIKWGEQVICIDGTRDLNGYNLQLYTLLVLDEYGEGIPVAFCFSNKATKELYKLFFAEVKKVINKSIRPYIFLSDGEMTFYDAWTETMSTAEHQLICHWHLNKIWVTNLTKIANSEKRNLVLQTLNALMMEQDFDTFEISLHQFLIRLQEDEETADFYQYFSENYINNVGVWAQCYRPFVPIHTNMSMEALHKNIRYNYLIGNRCIRLDKTIHALLCLVQDKKFERLIKFAKENPSEKLSKINESHEKSAECDQTVEELGKEKWSVGSFTNCLQKYDVQFLKYEPCCVHICEKCRICLHMLTCSCPDYTIEQNICEHIHVVMRLQQDNRNNVVLPEVFQDIVFHPVTELNNSTIEHINEHLINDDLQKQSNSEKSRLIAKVSAISGILENATLSNEQNSKIQKFLDLIAEEISRSTTSTTGPQIAPNEEIVEHTFVPTKKKNENEGFIPPSSLNSRTVIQGLISDENEVLILTQNLTEHSYV